MSFRFLREVYHLVQKAWPAMFINFILDGSARKEKFEQVLYEVQTYDTGKNLIITLVKRKLHRRPSGS